MSKTKERPVSKPVESKEDKFVRVVTPRIGKAVKSISLIGNCAGSGYAYTESQKQQLILTLRREIDMLEARYSRVKEKQEAFQFENSFRNLQ